MVHGLYSFVRHHLEPVSQAFVHTVHNMHWFKVSSDVEHNAKSSHSKRKLAHLFNAALWLWLCNSIDMQTHEWFRQSVTFKTTEAIYTFTHNTHMLKQPSNCISLTICWCDAYCILLRCKVGYKQMWAIAFISHFI